MNRLVLLFSLFLLNTACALAQGTVKGRILEKSTSEPLQFVNVLVSRQGETKTLKGGITDEKGSFSVSGLGNGNYTLTVSFMGYKNLTRNFNINNEKKIVSYGRLFLSEDSKMLGEVTVTGQRSEMKLEVDRKSFDVSQQIINAGGAASDVLENIPSVEVDNDGNISLRGNTSVEVWINGKASGLTTDNRAEILQQLPAESIERIEVIDNPSAKFSAEGSAGIINIVLKKDRKAGYYGSLQAGGSTDGAANTSGNINYNSGLFDAYLNIGYRHRKSKGEASSYQESYSDNQYQHYNSESEHRGNNLFSRAGLTWHATKSDDFSVSGMMMKGGHNDGNSYPYHYGTIGSPTDSRIMTRRNTGDSDMRMLYGEFNYRHNFTDKHFIDFVADIHSWKMDNDQLYQDSTEYLDSPERENEYSYQHRPMYMRSRRWEIKLDYENPITENISLQAGYQGNFSHENSPQESYIDNTWEGENSSEDKEYFNRFIYDMDLHALYATATMKFNKFGVMTGLRGEYWKVNTESYTWEQEHDATKREPAFKKDYFQLFPSLFLSYQLTETQQLQLNYTRRLRRPWGGQLNSFKNTRDASIISFGNPELTPEYSHSFSLNYLKTWTEHSLMLSAYYRPTTDVMQRISYQNSTDGMMYQTTMNVARSLSTGVEMVLKNKLFRILDLTTTGNAYYYKLNGFNYDIDGQTVTGQGNSNFTWNARMQASLILPYGISVQATGRYRSRQVITQGYRKANYSMDLGLRKSFLNKTLTLSVNCRDLFNSRKWESFTSNETFSRHQINKRRSRNVRFTLTYNFGNMRAKKPKMEQEENNMQDSQMNYGGEEQ